MSDSPARWLVLGAGGQVGGALCEALGPAAVPSRRTGSWALDLETVAAHPDVAARLLDSAQVDVVVLSAAMTDVERCESDEDLARTVNTDAARAVATAAVRLGTRMVYLSTDYVFDGQGGPYTESDRPHPLSTYGRTKLAGEEAVLAASADNLVVRTTVVYGPEEQGRNFAYRVGATLSAGRSLVVPSDQLGTPTYNRDLAAAIVAAVGIGHAGVLHIAGALMGRGELARRLASAASLDARWIVEAPTSALGQRAPRPLLAGLASSHPSHHRSVDAAVADWRTRPRGAPWPIAQTGAVGSQRPIMEGVPCLP